jgi:L,D-peptidoglycan transpeptidase YkuD (ErfK/YbiS/YcfS/YnhG family)
MRSDGGATTQQIMDATGCSEQRVRAAVSEIRTRIGDAGVVTGTQQANGASYGDGTNHTSYTVLFAFETTTDGATLLPEHRIGNPSIWAGLSDDLFEWWHNRVETLTR